MKRMQWSVSHRADPAGAALADLHYSRGKHGTPQFVQAAKCLVLVRPSDRETARYEPAWGSGKLRGADAVWVTTWPFAEYVRHAWGGDPDPDRDPVRRLLRVNPETGVPGRGDHYGHRNPLPEGFAGWASNEIVKKLRGGQTVPFREAWVRETPGTWACTLFRNESGVLSSYLIRQAVAATRAFWGDPPPLGMVTMIQKDAVRSSGAGRSYQEAGFELAGETKTRPVKNVFLLRPENMPAPRYARGMRQLLAAS